MKKIACSLLAATAALLSLASPARAGILTLDDGSPTFTPPDNFSGNTIVADTIVVGGLIHLEGTTTVMPENGDSATIMVSGTYSATAGEMFSVAFKFAGDLNAGAAATYTLEGSVSGIPITPITGTVEPGLHLYEGEVQAPQFPLDSAGTFEGSLTITFAPTAAPLAALPNSLDLTVQQIDFKLDPLPATVQEPAQALNIATRVNVGTGENVLIGGFIITGNDPKLVVLRGIGPSLGVSNVSGVLADPILTLIDENGAVVATNDNWMDNSSEDQMTLADAGLEPTEDAESAIVTTLDPGSYTAILNGAGDTAGVALVEAYDLDNGTTDSKLANISTRGFVETGDNVMIAGLTLGGGGGGLSTVVVRGIGPSLTGQNISGALADPTLELFNDQGDMIDSNDNWMDDPNQQQVSDADLAPSDPNEAALYKILPAGQYTAIVAGAGDTTGVALVETYELSDPVPASAR